MVFVNRLTADGKYPVLDFETLLLQIPMSLSEKRNSFSEFFVLFVESTPNFKDFEKKDHCHS